MKVELKKHFFGDKHARGSMIRRYRGKEEGSRISDISSVRNICG